MFLRAIVLYLTFFSFSYEQQQCINGGNCPFNQGTCVSNQCKCYKGYVNLFDKSLPADQQIYCNYERIPLDAPITLEIFLPSIGHFYVGKYWFGAIKLSLLIIYVVSSLYLYLEIRLPPVFVHLFQKIDVFKFLGEEEEGEDKEKDDDDEKEKLRGANIENTENSVNIKKNIRKTVIYIYEKSGFILTIFYFADLFFYKIGFYKDGNGVDFI